MSHSSSSIGALPVLIADSNRMQSRLLANALHRRPEFRVSICPIDANSIGQAVVLMHARVLLVALNPSASLAGQMAAMRQVHLSYPEVAKILLTESYDRELVISAFRSGARGIFCLTNTHFRLGQHRTILSAGAYNAWPRVKYGPTPNKRGSCSI
jgi:DNA-binding NarL/FixJ family response regulator